MPRPAAVVLSSVLVALACCLGWASARYHEKTRFDRSVLSDAATLKHARIHDAFNKKQRVLTDGESHYTAYKDAAKSVCYLERMRNNRFDDVNAWRDVIRTRKNHLHASDRTLAKVEAWRLAGSRIVDFCRGLKMVLLQEEDPPSHPLHPYHNELPDDDDESYAFQKRARTRREAQPRGRFRGQTQSQYLSVGPAEKEVGKAEAEATLQSSRAVVSGSSGMGQAQSMSSGSEGCEGCPSYAAPGSIMATLTGGSSVSQQQQQQQGVPSGVEESLSKPNTSID